MLKEITRICPQTLHKIMKEQNVPHHKIANALGISTKTIQRWLNGKTRSLSPDMAAELSKILEVPTKALTLNTDNIRRRPTNKVLAKLTSSQRFETVRAREDWDDYIDVLSTFVRTDLSSDQEMELNLCMGVAYLYEGVLKAAQMKLCKSLKIAEDLQDQETIVSALAWLAVIEELRGNHQEVRASIKQLQSLYDPKFSPSTLVTLHLIIGRLQVNTKDLAGAEITLKKGIIIGFKNHRDSLTRIAVMKYYLGWIYLKQRNLKKSKIYFTKLLEASTRAGWTRGINIGYHGLAVIESFLHHEVTPAAYKLIRKGRLYRKIDNARKMETKVEQLRFVLAIISKKFDLAESIAEKRYESGKASIEFCSYVTVDMLFLSKIEGSTYKMKPGMISKARATIKKAQLQQALDVIDYLEKVPSITTEKFIELYTFL